MRSVQRSTGTLQLEPLARLEPPFEEAVARRARLVEHDLVRQPQIEMERPRLGVDLVGQVQQLEAVDLLALPLPPKQRRRDVPAFFRGLAERRGIVLKRAAFDHQLAVIGEHAQLVAGLDLFARRDGDPLHVEQMVAAAAARFVRVVGRANRERLQQFARFANLGDLLVAEPVQQERLLAGQQRRVELLLLVLLFEHALARDHAFAERLEPGDLAVDHVEALDVQQVVALGGDDVFVREPDAGTSAVSGSTASPGTINTSVTTPVSGEVT